MQRAMNSALYCLPSNFPQDNRKHFVNKSNHEISHRFAGSVQSTPSIRSANWTEAGLVLLRKACTYSYGRVINVGQAMSGRLINWGPFFAHHFLHDCWVKRSRHAHSLLCHHTLIRTFHAYTNTLFELLYAPVCQSTTWKGCTCTASQ